jgi:Reverse transcriptase (RNA-dependent DNA polymerase)
VNNYQALNTNTVIDSHPLPHIDNILADCTKGKVWSIIDMTNSFFQTRVHPDDIHLTAVTTPLGLYEWLAMPMGLQNSPAIHQHHVTAALREYIGKICHIYLDDIVIWSKNIADHTKYIDLIIKALEKARLYCNLKKCKLFHEEIYFLGHHISSHGVETLQILTVSCNGRPQNLLPMFTLSWASYTILQIFYPGWQTTPPY